MSTVLPYIFNGLPLFFAGLVVSLVWRSIRYQSSLRLTAEGEVEAKGLILGVLVLWRGKRGRKNEDS